MAINSGDGGTKRSDWLSSISEPGMLLASVTMICLAAGIIYGSPDTEFFAVVWFCMALGFGIGMLLIRLRCVEAWMQPGWALSEICFLVSSALCIAAFSYWCGMRQFGGFDQSVVIDAAWRLYSGQKPYTDFICTLPVGFYIGAEMAFRWFGVFWSSIVKLNALYFLITYFWTYAVLREVFSNRYLAMVLVITCECMSLILNSYWWYNPATSITVIVYVASVAAVLLRPSNGWLLASLCVSLALAALMKPNVAAVAIFGGSLALIMSPRTITQAVAVSAIALVLWLGVILLHGSNLAQVVDSYLSVAGHGFSYNEAFRNVPSEEAAFDIASLCTLLPGLGHVFWSGTAFRGRLGLQVLGAGAMLACLFGFYVNGEPKLVDLSVGLIATALLMGKTSGNSLRISPRWAAYLILICSIFTLSSLGQAATRCRIRSIGMGTFFEYSMEKAPVRNDFFKGMSAGHNLHLIVDAITALHARQNTQNIYFGPRLQWAYAAFHIPSPKGMPIWWHPTTAFDPKDEEMLTNRWIENRYDPVVLVDFSFMNEKFIKTILHSYVLQKTYPLTSDAGSLLILELKK